MDSQTFVAIDENGALWSNFDPSSRLRELPAVVRNIPDGETLDSEDIEDVSYWMDRGGKTVDQLGSEPFRKLDGGGDPNGYIDVAVMPDGTIWAVGAQQGIWYYRDDAWKRVDGSCRIITADNNGDVYVAQSNLNIYTRPGINQPWKQITGGALEIKAKNGRVVYLTGPTEKNYEIYRKDVKSDSNNRIWGAVAKIDLTNDGKFQAIGPFGGIFARNNDGNGWIQRPGAATDLSVGSDNSLFFIYENKPYFYDQDSNSFTKITELGDIKKVNALTKDKLAVIKDDGQIYVNFKREPKTEYTDDEIERGYYDTLAYPQLRVAEQIESSEIPYYHILIFFINLKKTSTVYI